MNRYKPVRRYKLACLLGLLIAVWCEREAPAQGAAEELMPESIRDAIRLGADEKASVKFLQPYTVQTRTGMGTGPLIGVWSTPFARVVLAASAARKEEKPSLHRMSHQTYWSGSFRSLSCRNRRRTRTVPRRYRRW
jgi:hypothetical protein